MELLGLVAVCFTLLFTVEVFLGAALPEDGYASAPGMRRMPLGAFFGQALPMAAAGLGLPMSLQHPWAVWLVVGAVVLHVLVCRVLKAC